MINENDFKAGIQKLFTQFGPKAFGPDRLESIRTEIKGMDLKDFEKLIIHLVNTSKTAPMLADFKKAIRDLGIKITWQGAGQGINQVIHNLAHNFAYPLTDGIFADDDYIFIRKGDRPSFVIKSENPDHEYVKFDKVNGKDKKAQAQVWLNNRTYQEEMTKLGFFKSPNQNSGMRRIFV